ncbi:MAG: class I SAM-dependent methyltransferase [Solirubrobacteraceae bacterium]
MAAAMSGLAANPSAQPAAASPDREVIWHDLECGSYAADLPLWQALAARQGSSILELGAGTGRVTLDLARRGHRLVAVDRDPRLLYELRRRAEDLEIETVVADARAFSLQAPVALCLVPMQMIQLLGGVAGRAAMFTCVARHLVPGGTLAIAISPKLERWSAGDGGGAPLPDTCERDGILYFSQPTAVYSDREGHVLERRRETVSPAGLRTAELDRIRLDHVRAGQLEREGAACGLTAAGRATVPATPDYASSQVVVFSA